MSMQIEHTGAGDKKKLLRTYYLPPLIIPFVLTADTDNAVMHVTTLQSVNSAQPATGKGGKTQITPLIRDAMMDVVNHFQVLVCKRGKPLTNSALPHDPRQPQEQHDTPNVQQTRKLGQVIKKK